MYVCAFVWARVCVRVRVCVGMCVRVRVCVGMCVGMPLVCVSVCMCTFSNLEAVKRDNLIKQQQLEQLASDVTEEKAKCLEIKR